MLMYDDKLIAAHFSLTQGPAPAGDDDGDDPGFGMGPLGPSVLRSGSFVKENYQVWERQAVQKLPWHRLLPWGALERWLYAHFLKICLPYPRPGHEQAPVHSPLNLTAVMRLVSHLYETGYPAHWLTTVLSALCGDSDVTTTTRPPRQLVSDLDFVDTVFPTVSMSVAPWRAELTNLLSIWSRLLPFGLMAPAKALVSPVSVAEYSVAFPEILDNRHVRVPHCMLVFWASCIKDAPPTKLRELLLDDETGDKSASAKETKEKGIHVTNSFRYVSETRTASFWFRTDVMDKMKDHGKWNVSIWRNDSWSLVTRGLNVKDHVALKRAWTK